MATPLSCKLGDAAFRERKATAIARLKGQLLEVRQLDDGYAYRFAGTDTMLDELLAFIKAERQCCSFFSFTLRVEDQEKDTWLELRGPAGAKEFIAAELELTA